MHGSHDFFRDGFLMTDRRQMNIQETKWALKKSMNPLHKSDKTMQKHFFFIMEQTMNSVFYLIYINGSCLYKFPSQLGMADDFTTAIGS